MDVCIDVCINVCVDVCVDVCTIASHLFAQYCSDMCIDVRIDMCIEVCIEACTDVRTDVRMEMVDHSLAPLSPVLLASAKQKCDVDASCRSHEIGPGGAQGMPATPWQCADRVLMAFTGLWSVYGVSMACMCVV